MTEKGVPAAKLLATDALALDVRMFRVVVASRVVRTSEDE
jgi:hypothetical protein